jgi:hypothetical protein
MSASLHIHSHLRVLSDTELLSHAQYQVNDLTSSVLEIELLKRFEEKIDEAIDNDPLLKVLDDYGVEEADELKQKLGFFNEFEEFEELDCRALLEAITAAGIDTAESLKARLARADEFDAIANDAGDLFARLNTLATKE